MGGHHNGPETHQTGLVDGLGRGQALGVLNFRVRSPIIMMAFFLTMPISMMMPTKELDVELVVEDQERGPARPSRPRAGRKRMVMG